MSKLVNGDNISILGKPEPPIPNATGETLATNNELSMCELMLIHWATGSQAIWQVRMSPRQEPKGAGRENVADRGFDPRTFGL